MPIKQLKERLSQLGVVFADNYINESQIKLSLALKKLAKEHLRGDSMVAQKFRGEILCTNHKAIEAYIANHGRNEEWGSHFETEALAEALGCHLIITAINSKTKSINTYQVRQEKLTDAPIMYLKCVFDHQLGGVLKGNCLYSAMALALDSYLTKNIQKKGSWLENSQSGLEIKIVTDRNERLELYNLVS
jgi:hypothetical protein